MAFEIDEDRAVRAALLEREISSTPSTLTFPTSGRGASLILLSKASRPTARPGSAASLAPALPPSSKAMASRASSSLPVLRAWAVTSGNLSQKISLSQEPSSQKKRRTRARRIMGVPCHGRSAILRTYRLWTRLEYRPHTGQFAEGATDAAKTTTRSWSMNRCSARSPFGMRS